MNITRRNLLRGTAATLTIAGTGFSTQLLAGQKTLKIGMNIPMTGDFAPWGLPGSFGCDIVTRHINEEGGVEIGGESYMVEPVTYDHGYNTEKAIIGFKTLVGDGASLIMMMGGSPVGAVARRAQRSGQMITTLLPSDLTPRTKNVVAPSEAHPLYNVTGVEWLHKNFPEAKTAVIVSTNDIEYGQQSAATYEAAFEVAGIEVLATNFHGFDVTDFAPIVEGLLANNPDIFCMATDVYTTPLVVALYHAGYKGKIISCTFDLYTEVIAKTSKEYVEGIIFQFPDFDDPYLNSPEIQYPDPNGFWDEFQKEHPGQWSAVSWQYPAMMNAWIKGAQEAGSIDPMDVLAAMKANPNPPHTFGPAKWWGKPLYGIDNAVVGNWPVVTIQDGRARIVENASVIGWLEKHTDVLIRKMKDYGLPIA